ncbi:MAG TPA: hypothetical protein VFV87_12185 [Pirellulaceae bacterium]|nr:hypothetical protein [Pirellulaceae bacterium]
METTIYDVRNSPRIYIAADGERSVYTWDGHAVAYIVGENVFGWHGKHIGWFVADILYDIKGHRIGFTATTCRADTYAEPVKYTKFTKAERFKPQVPYRRPVFSQLHSNQDIDAFIRQNAP